MPRPKKAGAPEPKTRSRNGCWYVTPWRNTFSEILVTYHRPCKARKIKCGEEKPKCQNCERQGETCDYSIRLNWEGRTKRKGGDIILQTSSFPQHQNTVSPVGDSDLDSPQVSRGSDFETSPTAAGSPESQGSLQSRRARGRPHLLPASMDAQPSHPNTFVKNASLHAEEIATPHLPVSTFDPTLGRMQSSGMAGQLEPLNFVNNNIGQDGRGPRDHFSAVQLSRIRDQGRPLSYPSPADSNAESPPNYLSTMSLPVGGHSSLPDPQMPPPFQSSFSPRSVSNNSRKGQDDVPLHTAHRSKRLRLSPTTDANDGLQCNQVGPYGVYNAGGALRSAIPHNATNTGQSVHQNPYNSSMGIPLTPAASSVASDENYLRSTSKSSSQMLQESPDLRRLSVKSLLSDDSPADSGTESALPTSPYIASSASTPVSNHGIDRGFPDLDLPNNNDSIALNGSTPSLSTVHLYSSEQDVVSGDDDAPAEFGFGIYGTHAAHGHGDYYAKPVIVTIPRSLGPLPSALQDNPMNMLYFHHFLNHTARILVPHDCSENPFKSILPQSKEIFTKCFSFADDLQWRLGIRTFSTCY